MQHSKSYIISQEIKQALGYLYREIETLERKVKHLGTEVERLKKQRE